MRPHRRYDRAATDLGTSDSTPVPGRTPEPLAEDLRIGAQRPQCRIPHLRRTIRPMPGLAQRGRAGLGIENAAGTFDDRGAAERPPRTVDGGRHDDELDVGRRWQPAERSRARAERRDRHGASARGTRRTAPHQRHQATASVEHHAGEHAIGFETGLPDSGWQREDFRPEADPMAQGRPHNLAERGRHAGRGGGRSRAGAARAR